GGDSGSVGGGCGGGGKGGIDRRAGSCSRGRGAAEDKGSATGRRNRRTSGGTGGTGGNDGDSIRKRTRTASLSRSRSPAPALSRPRSPSRPQLPSQPQTAPASERAPPPRSLAMEYWIRTEECKEIKSVHLDYIDDHYVSREALIEDTVFTDPATGHPRDPVLEPNMFPYATPPGVEHWTLWSRRDMSEADVEAWVGRWLARRRPDVVCWNYDDNAGDRSILWFHVHVYMEVG
ncbi:unnamed protein product, partial [Phaeothamnion confervicola]